MAYGPPPKSPKNFLCTSGNRSSVDIIITLAQSGGAVRMVGLALQLPGVQGTASTRLRILRKITRRAKRTFVASDSGHLVCRRI